MISNSEYARFVQRLYVNRNSGGEGLVHGIIGLQGELIEFRAALDRENQLEELGDIEYYFEALRSLVCPLEDWIVALPNLEIKLNLHEAWDTCLDYSTDFMDTSKKVWVYNKPLDEPTKYSLRGSLCVIRDCLTVIQSLTGFTRQAALEHNVEKLRRRYPTGYTDAAAAARADKEGKAA